MEKEIGMEIVSLVLVIAYAAFLIWCRMGWKKIKYTSSGYSGLTKVSIVIALRNEEHFIQKLLSSIVKQEYPARLMELIFVDDHSEDNTKKIVNDFFIQHASYNVKVLSADSSGKKAAIKKGVNSAWHELILTTDGDCELPQKWVTQLVSIYEKYHPVFIAGPVKLTHNSSVIGKLQFLEMAGLIGIAGGSLSNGKPMLCNGANLAFSRSAWLKAMEHIQSTYSSGDDTDLLVRLTEEYPDQMIFLKDESTVVQTNAAGTVRSFIQQRQRWASKITGSMSRFTVFIAVLAWLVHFTLFIQLIFAVIHLHFSGLFLGAVLIKALSEATVIGPVVKLYKLKRWDQNIILLQPLYWFYIILVGLSGPLLKYEWKGRKLR